MPYKGPFGNNSMPYMHLSFDKTYLNQEFIITNINLIPEKNDQGILMLKLIKVS